MTNLADNYNSSKTKSTFSQGEEIERKIPLFAENFDVTKKTEETQLNLKKKWVTTTKKIEIPIRYEEMLINDKELDLYNEGEITEIFSKIKHKITDVFSHHEKNNYNENKDSENKDKEEHHYQQQHGHHSSHDIEVRKYGVKSNEENNNKNQNNVNEKLVPFSVDGNNNDSSINKREENIIPLWGEEIIIDKRMVKIGEIVIRKYQTNEKQKIDVDIKSEQLTIKYPDDRKEEII
jgi:stress response protein YsnF